MNNNVRQSNVELLKIIAILLIISCHCCVFSASGHYTFEFNKLSWGGTDVFLIAKVNCLFARIWNNAGQWGNNIFFMITGYFVINHARKFKSLLKIWGTTCFYSVAFFIIMCKFMHIQQPDGSSYNFFTAMAPITHNTYWFITDYLFLMIIMPLIVKALAELTLKQYRYMLLFLFFSISVIPMVELIYGREILFSNGADNFFNTPFFQCLFIVLIGGYISRDGNVRKVPIYFLWAMLFIGLAAVCAYNIKLFEDGNAWMRIVNITQTFNLLVSLALFCLFLRINIGSVDLVNNVAKSVFGVYLIHENPFIRILIWAKLFNNNDAFLREYFVAYVFAEAIIVFLFCVVVDWLKRSTFNKIYEFTEPYIKKWIRCIGVE